MVHIDIGIYWITTQTPWPRDQLERFGSFRNRFDTVFAMIYNRAMSDWTDKTTGGRVNIGQLDKVEVREMGTPICDCEHEDGDMGGEHPVGSCPVCGCR